MLSDFDLAKQSGEPGRPARIAQIEPNGVSFVLGFIFCVFLSFLFSYYSLNSIHFLTPKCRICFLHCYGVTCLPSFNSGGRHFDKKARRGKRKTRYESSLGSRVFRYRYYREQYRKIRPYHMCFFYPRITISSS